MTFKDVRKFCQRLLCDLTFDLTGEEIDEETFFKGNKKNKLDE
jgi:hypothetical protein